MSAQMPVYLVVCLLLWLPLAAQADDAAVKQGVARLFEVGAQNTVKARAAAEEHYNDLKNAAPTDVRITYAYALVQIKHHKYAEASKLLDEVVAARKTDRQAWKAKSWLSVITKNYAAALVDLDRLSQLLPADAAEGDEEEQHLELSRYLGRVFGFLEGPAADAVIDPQREAARKKILARLTEPRQLAFEEGRSRVLAAWSGLGVEKEESEEKAKGVAEEEREKLLKDLETRKAQLAERRAEIGPRREKLRSELTAERDSLAKEERPFLADLNVINAQAAGIRRELDFYAADILRLQWRFEREKDPVLRDRLRRELDRTNFLAARVDGNLATLQRQAAGVQAQLAEVQRRHLQAAARINGELARLDNESAALDKQEKRHDIDTGKAKKPAVGDVRRSRAISAQAAAFTTYEEFPLEAEKQRLLDSYK
jgi:hypothetical protein